HHVDMSGGIPVSPGVRAVRIAERDMDTGNFFVLQDVADHVANADVGADGEFADAVAELVGMAVLPELIPQFVVGAASLAQTAVLHANRERSRAEIAVLLAQ